MPVPIGNPVPAPVVYPPMVLLPGTGYGADEKGAALTGSPEPAPEPTVTVTVAVKDFVTVTAGIHPLPEMADSLGPAELLVGKEP